MPRIAYIDSSALTKLAMAEPGTADLEAYVLALDGLVCSRLGATELRRAAARFGQRRLLQSVDDVLEAVVLIEVSPTILEAAAHLKPWTLRTLDAIHLATLQGFDEPVELITYDNRLATAAKEHGFAVAMPGR